MVKLEHLKKWFNTLCKENNTEPDLYDLQSAIDSSLSIEENKELIKQKFGLKEKHKLTKQEIKELKQELRQEELQEINNAIKTKNNYYKNDLLESYLKAIETNHINSLIILGKAGIGKTYSVVNYFNNKNSDYVYVNGFSTTLALYKFIYNNKDKLIILDDMELLFQDNKTISILKALTYGVNNKRIVMYETTSDKLDVPASFEFTGKIILLLNEIPQKNNESYKALLSRIPLYELKYTDAELRQICLKLLNQEQVTQEQKNKIISILYKQNKLIEFNIRTFKRLIGFVKYDINKAETLYFNSFKISKDKQVVLELLNKKELSEKERVIRFTEITGKSRRTYFRIKKELVP